MMKCGWVDDCTMSVLDGPVCFRMDYQLIGNKNSVTYGVRYNITGNKNVMVYGVQYITGK